jgi:hypothetical protein
VREQACLRPVGDPQLVQHAGHVALHRCLGQVQARGDLGVRQALAETREYPGLPFGQRGDQFARLVASGLAVGRRGDEAARGRRGQDRVALRRDPDQADEILWRTDLTRNPAAPARRARSTYWSASKVVRTTTTGRAGSWPMRSMAVIPRSYFDGPSALQYYVPAIAALSVLGSCYGQLAVALAVRRQNGILKRVRATPLPAWAYFGADWRQLATLAAWGCAGAVIAIRRFRWDPRPE